MFAKPHLNKQFGFWWIPMPVKICLALKVSIMFVVIDFEICGLISTENSAITKVHMKK